MSQHVITIEIEVFDPERLAKVAAEQAVKTGISLEDWEETRNHGLDPDPDDEGANNQQINNDLIMLLDPGNGGEAYAGDLNEAGIQIVNSSSECIDDVLQLIAGD